MGCQFSSQKSSIIPTNQHDQEDLYLKGISIHYLQNVFLKEVQDYDLDVSQATVYDLEPDLKSKTNLGLIRRKGEKTICPRDGKLGAAYVDSIEKGNGFTEPASVMVSYTWGYRIQDIVSTLVEKCQEDGRDPKKTYVWMCCLCNNQHRWVYVQEQEETGGRLSEEKELLATGPSPSSSFEKWFHAIFFRIVQRIGLIWSIVTPDQNDSAYLKRVWCLLEIYIANTVDGVKSEIIMAKEHKERMANHSKTVSTFLDTLANTKIENARASREEDKQSILNFVKKDIGFAGFNKTVDIVLRKWMSSMLMTEAELTENEEEKENWRYYNNSHLQEETKTNDFDIAHTAKLFNIARAFHEHRMGSTDTVMQLYILP